MSPEPCVRDLVSRVRRGEARAAEELVRRYEPQIRREIRLRLTDPHMRPVLDSMDICQSVLGSFFVRVALGEYELDDPGQLFGLLVRMTRNKVADQVRKHRAARRDLRRTRSLDDSHAPEPIHAESTPSEIVSLKDLYGHVCRRLSEEERQLVDRRAAGSKWSEIAAELGDSPDALRMKLSRASRRICAELGLDGSTDE